MPQEGVARSSLLIGWNELSVSLDELYGESDAVVLCDVIGRRQAVLLFLTESVTDDLSDFTVTHESFGKFFCDRDGNCVPAYSLSDAVIAKSAAVTGLPQEKTVAAMIDCLSGK